MVVAGWLSLLMMSEMSNLYCGAWLACGWVAYLCLQGGHQNVLMHDLLSAICHACLDACRRGWVSYAMCHVMYDIFLDQALGMHDWTIVPRLSVVACTILTLLMKCMIACFMFHNDSTA